MSFVPAIELSELKKNNRMTKVINNSKILFIWHNDKVHAVQAQCPHLKLPLKNGKVNDKNELTCPFHHSSFDLCTGDVKCWSTFPPVVGDLLGKISKPKNLKIYQTEIKGDQILVGVD
ncbi:MAG: Rieske (2Fe-2S) protein [Legionellaceae bacterium]|nr:Rieske (2Fe-2S) protein [Legionellaceae bacterium]